MNVIKTVMKGFLSWLADEKHCFEISETSHPYLTQWQCCKCGAKTITYDHRTGPDAVPKSNTLCDPTRRDDIRESNNL